MNSDDSRPSEEGGIDADVEVFAVPVLIGLGANLGKPVDQLRDAVRRLGSSMEIAAVSLLYQTEPIGITDQPDFLNIVVRGSTDLTVFDLHRNLQAIEKEMGRVRGVRNGPRHIDIDLLSFGELKVVSESLTIPHPRLHERRFVLVPLIDVFEGWLHPRLARSAAELLEGLDDHTVVTPIGTLPT